MKVRISDRCLIAVTDAPGIKASERFDAAKKDSRQKVTVITSGLSNATEEVQRAFRALEAEV